MQTLAAEIAITFVDDATALITGCGRIVVRILTAPIERLANACDVAGALPQKRSSKDMHDVEIKRTEPGPNAEITPSALAARQSPVFVPLPGQFDLSEAATAGPQASRPIKSASSPQ